MKPWHPGCQHPKDDPDNDQFCIFCLRKRGDDFESALGRIAECAYWCEDCEPTEHKLATHTTHPYGAPMFLCDEHAELARAAYRKSESKGCGKQPEVEPLEQEVETTIALKALGLMPPDPCSDSAGGSEPNG